MACWKKHGVAGAGEVYLRGAAAARRYLSAERKDLVANKPS